MTRSGTDFHPFLTIVIDSPSRFGVNWGCAGYIGDNNIPKVLLSMRILHLRNIFLFFTK